MSRPTVRMAAQRDRPTRGARWCTKRQPGLEISSVPGRYWKAATAQAPRASAGAPGIQGRAPPQKPA